MHFPMTWKAVFFIWLLAMPFMVGASAVAYQKYPAPFRVTAAWGLKEFKVGKQYYAAYQQKKAAEAKEAAKKAKEAEEEAAPGF